MVSLVKCEVYKAAWRMDKDKLDLAVKTLKAGASEEDKVKFLQEAAIMGQFSHTNVIKMYGVVTLGEPVSGSYAVVTEKYCYGITHNAHMHGKRLLQFLYN